MIPLYPSNIREKSMLKAVLSQEGVRAGIGLASEDAEKRHCHQLAASTGSHPQVRCPGTPTQTCNRSWSLALSFSFRLRLLLLLSCYSSVAGLREEEQALFLILPDTAVLSSP